MKNLHKQTNCIPNLVMFITRDIARMILPLNQLDVRHYPT